MRPTQSFWRAISNGKLLDTDQRRSWISRQLPNANIEEANDHEVDAIISAWATKEALNAEAGHAMNAWRDLALSAPDTLSLIKGVHYYWPN